MKKLYRVTVSTSREILVAAENETQLRKEVGNNYGNDALSYSTSGDFDIEVKEINNKKFIWNDEWSEIPYGDERTIKEIWKDIEKSNKDREYKEWLEKNHMTFEFYKANTNG